MTKELVLKEFREKLNKLYEDARAERIKKKESFKITDKKAKIRYMLKRVTSMKDLDVISIIHFDEQGDVYLVPAILEGDEVYYKTGVKEHFKILDEISRFHYFDNFVEDGLVFHEYKSNSIRINPNVDEKLKITAKELQKDRKDLAKMWAGKTVLEIAKKNMSALKYFIIVSAVGGFGVGVIMTLWLLWAVNVV